MQLYATLLAAALSATAFAAPVSMMAASQSWTIENMKRVCTANGKSCTWTFGIEVNTAAATPCKFVVKGNPAADTDSSGHVCGPYTVSTGWSGQFGPGNGFTTLAVVNNAEKLIAYPAYTDTQLAGGKVVKPNQSYTPQSLP